MPNTNTRRKYPLLAFVFFNNEKVFEQPYLSKSAYAQLSRTALNNSPSIAYDPFSMGMNQSTLFLTLNRKWNDAIHWANQQLAEAGMRTVLTFDFQTVRSTQVDCTCPYHGTESCDCQMVVLLVYDGNRTPVSLLVHGNEDHTWFYLADSAMQRGDPELEAAVRRALDGNSIDLENSVEMTINPGNPENDSEEIVNERRQVFPDRKKHFIDWLNKHR